MVSMRLAALVAAITTCVAAAVAACGSDGSSGGTSTNDGDASLDGTSADGDTSDADAASSQDAAADAALVFGKRLAYIGLAPTGTGRVFVVDVSDAAAPGPPVDVSGSVVDGSSGVSNPTWSPNGASLVFAKSISAGPSEIDLVRFGAGGAAASPIPISLPIAYPAMPGLAVWGPDSKRLYYTTYNPVFSLVYADVSGASPVATTLPVPALPSLPKFSPAGDKLAFVTDGPTGKNELYVVDVSTATPGAPVRIGPAAGANELTSDFAWFPDGHAIAFRRRVVDGGGVSAESEVFISDMTGATPGAAILLSGAIVPNGQIAEFVLAPNGSGIVLRGDLETIGLNELYWVPVTGTTPGARVKLNGPVTGAGVGALSRAAVASTSDRVAFSTSTGVSVASLGPAPSPTAAPPPNGETGPGYTFFWPGGRYLSVFRGTASGGEHHYIFDVATGTPSNPQLLVSTAAPTAGYGVILSPSPLATSVVTGVYSTNTFFYPLVWQSFIGGVLGAPQAVGQVVYGNNVDQTPWFSPDGTRLATAGSIRVVNTAAGTLGPPAAVTGLRDVFAWSP